ncbi:MAG: hypothetical protein CFE34_19455 [Rhodobacteraceae bacterium PARR1]|nr:MAG: hypothetical protein CFE34_19455 [Rhodobacteraceae bacterium PARR1]
MSWVLMRDSSRLRAIVLWLIAATLAVFTLFPGIDPAVSALFWSGSRFAVNSNQTIETLRYGLWNLTLMTFAIVLAGLIRAAIRAQNVAHLPVHIWAFFSATFAVGPGLVVNLLLKEHWGRARPFQTTLFGGEKHFTPPWDMTDQCLRNCSFVSGEVAGTTALAVVMVVAAWHLRAHLSRLSFLTLVIVAPLLVVLSALQRISAGRHFLSDAILAALFTLLIAVQMYRWIVERGGPRRALIRWGASLHRFLLGRERV